MLCRALLVLELMIASAALGQEKPPLPSIDDGACPFECCTYREWKATRTVSAYFEPKNGSAVAFSIKNKQIVKAETGFVSTLKAGVTKVVKQITLGYRKDSNESAQKPILNLKPGELLYTLHYMGEGNDLFWYNGKVFYDQIAANKPHPPPPPAHLSLQVLSRPVTMWWVKVKTKDGRIGWLKNPPYFENSDACS